MTTKPTTTPLYALVPYEGNREKRLAWQAVYRAKRERVAPVNKAHYHATSEQHPTYWPNALPPGQFVGHCGQWIEIISLPVECPVCHVNLFTEEDMHMAEPHGRDRAAYYATYYEVNRERIRATQAQYYQQNKEKFTAKYQANRVQQLKLQAYKTRKREEIPHE